MGAAQPYTIHSIVTDELQPVGPALGSDRHAVRKQKRVRAYVAEDHDVERVDFLARKWERLHRNVARLIGQFGAAGAKGGDHLGPSFVVGGHVEGIETLGVDAMRHPGFAGEKDAYWISHQLRSLKGFYDCLLNGIRNAIIPADMG